MSKVALTISEVARETGHSERQIYRLLKAGKLKARKSGRKTVVLVEDMNRWLADLPDAGLEAA